MKIIRRIDLYSDSLVSIIKYKEEEIKVINYQIEELHYKKFNIEDELKDLKKKLANTP